jgi:hypothetical protein
MSKFLHRTRRKQLIRQHKGERDGRIRDRIKAVLLYDIGLEPDYSHSAYYLNFTKLQQPWFKKAVKHFIYLQAASKVLLKGPYERPFTIIYHLI